MLSRLLLQNALILTAIWFVLLPSPAQAYFDLGTGTYMVNVLLAFIAVYWLSAKQFWTKNFRKTKESVPKDPPTPEDPPTAEQG